MVIHITHLSTAITLVRFLLFLAHMFGSTGAVRSVLKLNEFNLETPFPLWEQKNGAERVRERRSTPFANCAALNGRLAETVLHICRSIAAFRRIVFVETPFHCWAKMTKKRRGRLEFLETQTINKH